MLQLSPRLAAVADMLRTDSVLADIGCDHGYLSAHMLLCGKMSRAYACDISLASVNKAARLAEECGLSGSMVVRQADGLSGLTELVGNQSFSIAVCGMGGELIARLLEAELDTARRASILVMQPMRGEAELRKYLHDNGFSIKDERVALDSGRYYQLISAAYGNTESVPDWFPHGFYRFGWIMAEKGEPQLLPLLRHYRAVYARELEKAELCGKRPQSILDEIAAVDIIIKYLLAKDLK